MSEFLTKTGQQRVSFGEYDTTNDYKLGDSIIYDGNVWIANDNIPANTPFTPGSSGATWSSKVVGLSPDGPTGIANGTSNLSIPVANGNINISSAGNANVAIITGTGANIAGTLTATGNVTGGNLTTGGVLSVTGNATVGNLTTSGRIVSSIATGTAPFTVTSTTTVANLNVAAAATAATVTTNAQPNITSVGNLSVLNVNGDINYSNWAVGRGIKNGNSNIFLQGNGSMYVYISGDTVSTLTVTSATVYIDGTLNVANGESQLGPVGNVKITGGSNGQVLTTNGTGTLSWTTPGANVTTTSIANGNSNVNIPSAGGNVLISSAGNANIAVITGTGANINGTLNVTGNANVGNLGVAVVAATTSVEAPQLFSSVSTGTSPFVVSSTTQVANLNSETAGTVITNAQPNITSVGTLSSLNVTGNIVTSNRFVGNGIDNGNSNITITSNGAINAYIGGNANSKFTINSGGIQSIGATITGNLSVSGGTANLGAVGNVIITGGSSSQVLTTDGSGGLSWTTPPGGNTWSLSTRVSGDIWYEGANYPGGVDISLGQTTFQNTSNNITYGAGATSNLVIGAKSVSTTYLLTAYINLSNVNFTWPTANLTFNWVYSSNNSILPTSIPLTMSDPYTATYPNTYSKYGICTALITVSGSAQTVKLRVTSNPANVNWTSNLGTGLTVTEV